MTKSDVQTVLDALEHCSKHNIGFQAVPSEVSNAAQQAIPAAQRLVDASGWQPIESAPRDRSIFWALQSQDFTDNDIKGESQGWLHLPRHPFLATMVQDEGEWFCIEVDNCGIHKLDCEPSWWMPLPRPPESEG